MREGELTCRGCGRVHPIVDFIPRFVADSYAGNFGFQWQLFAGTQLDSRSGVAVSRDRFFHFSGWDACSMEGKLVLDAGCGAGRFAEIALGTGAEVVAIDLSSAVDACRANLAGNERLHVVQCDLTEMPFPDGTFDCVYSFGVLQHTPRPAHSFASLVPKLRDGGRIAIDIYPKTIVSPLLPQYWLRPLIRRLPRRKLLALTTWMVRLLLPISNVIGWLPFGRKIRRLLPVANYDGIYPFTKSQHREWSMLDTFDMFSPTHDHPQTASAVRRWFADGFSEFEVFRAGFLVGRGRKKVHS